MAALEEFQTDGFCNNWVVGFDPFKTTICGIYRGCLSVQLADEPACRRGGETPLGSTFFVQWPGIEVALHQRISQPSKC